MPYERESEMCMNFQDHPSTWGCLGLFSPGTRGYIFFLLGPCGSGGGRFLRLLHHASAKPDNYLSISTSYNDYRFYSTHELLFYSCFHFSLSFPQ